MYQSPVALLFGNRFRNTNIFLVVLSLYISNFDSVIEVIGYLILLDKGIIMVIKGIPTLVLVFIMYLIPILVSGMLFATSLDIPPPPTPAFGGRACTRYASRVLTLLWVYKLDSLLQVYRLDKVLQIVRYKQLRARRAFNLLLPFYIILI